MIGSELLVLVIGSGRRELIESESQGSGGHGRSEVGQGGGCGEDMARSDGGIGDSCRLAGGERLA